MEWNHFITTILLHSYLKINNRMYMDIFPFLPIPPNFGGNEYLRFWGKMKE